MELIIVCVLFYLVCAWLGGPDDSGSSSYSRRTYKKSIFASSRVTKTQHPKSNEEFEEAGSFYDRDGNEHIIDDDNYCEDCDDYHDN